MKPHMPTSNESAVRSYSRTFPDTFTKASGSLIYGQNDREYIDFFSGAGALNYGHNHPALKKSMITYLEEDGILHGLDMATEAKDTFIYTFTETILRPRSLDYRIQFTGPTGTNAVEAALKLSKLISKRSNVIAFTHAFHGVSLGSLATTSNSWFRNASGVELHNVTFMPYDNYIEGFDSIGYLRKLLTDSGSGIDTPAAVIVETIQGEGGVNVASKEWLQSLRRLTKEFGILLIVDEIQAGCGRSGDFFSFEDSGIVPDMITLSKSISGSGLPMSILLIKPEYDIWKPGQHNGTFRGNNLAFISATAAIMEFWTNNSFSIETIRKGKIIEKSLRKMVLAYPELQLSVRGRGMFYGIEFCKNPEHAKRVSQYAFARGLIIELAGPKDEVLKLLPALTIDDSLLLNGLEVIKQALSTLSD
jgi:diaminobutyrate-2-oxoglutarate transaminase